MKKIIFGAIAILSVFTLAMTSCGGGDDGGTPTFTVTFNSDGGSSVAPKTGVASGSKITEPTAPTKADHTFIGWFKANGTQWNFDVDKVTGNITLTAHWLQGNVNLEDIVILGEYTITDGDSKAGWRSNGTDSVTTSLEWDSLAAAKYLILQTKGSGNRSGFGGLQVAIQSDTTTDAGNSSWAYLQTELWGDWFSFPNLATDTVTIVIDLTSIDGWDQFITGTQGKLIIGYYTNTLADLGIQGAQLYLDDYEKPEDAEDFSYGFIYSDAAAVQPGEKTPVVEELQVFNQWYAIYKFDLGATTVGNYGDIEVDYKIASATTSIRARILGNYTDVDIANPRLMTNTSNPGKTYNIAVLGSWPGGTSNRWLLNTKYGGGGAVNSAGMFASYDPMDDDWFTAVYPNGLVSDHHGDWDGGSDLSQSLPGRKIDANTTGVLYLGISMTSNAGAENPITFQQKNVVLKGKNGTADVVAKPVFYNYNNTLYRAYAGQIDGELSEDGPNMAGGNAGWTIISGDDYVVLEATGLYPTPITISYDTQWPNDDTAPTTPTAVTMLPGDKLEGDVQIPTLAPPTTPPDGEFNGWNFDGWFTAATGGFKVFNKYLFYESGTIYAQWTPVNVSTISFNLGSATGTKPDVKITKGGGFNATQLAIPAGVTAPTGKVFGGWYTEVGLTNLVTSLTKITTDTATLYAKWYTPYDTDDLIFGDIAVVASTTKGGGIIDEDGYVIFAGSDDNALIGGAGRDTFLNFVPTADFELPEIETVGNLLKLVVTYDAKWIVQPVKGGGQESWTLDAAGIWKLFETDSNGGGGTAPNNTGSYFSFVIGDDSVLEHKDSTKWATGISIQINKGDDANNSQKRAGGIFGIKITDIEVVEFTPAVAP